jgi:SNF2 family DNA or RNA helicase
MLKRKSSFKALIDSIASPDEHDFECPKALRHILRDYQLIGFQWLKTLAKFGFGGILADDMGLGKTLQTIAFIMSEYELGQRPTLIITPTSLVYNWSEEIHKFLPDLDVLIIDGQPQIRESLIETCMDYPIVITSYPLIRRDATHYESIQFNYCIIDEAQHIKNPKSLNAMSVKQIHANGYFALTGTPIENHLTELWSIFDFVMPKLLFNHQKFTNVYEVPITRDQNATALLQLKKTIRPFILRRLKSEVLTELPEKIETKLVATLSDDQKKLYLAHLEEAKSTLHNEIANNTFKQNQLKILSMITRLRQICCHPAMFIEDYKGDSGKLDLVMELIEDSIESGHKILLFSQYTSMLAIIRKKLEAINIKYAYLDGKVPSLQRKDVIHDFNHGDIPIFLISLKAGGTGLNLTTADIVIHYDPWWNPAVEDQATDRAYRIGQEKNVQVFKLIAKGTIEEKIFNLQQKKKALANSVIESGETFITSMTSDDIMDLLDI